MIPKIYRDIAFDRFPVTEIEPEATVARDAAILRPGSTRMVDAGRGLWLMGTNGNGKTTLAMLVTQAALKGERSAARYTLPDLLRQIRRHVRHRVARRPVRAAGRGRSAPHR